MIRQKMLAESVRQSRELIARYFKGFNDSNRTAQAPNLPNHFAWSLGHLALTIHRAAEQFDGRALPESHFVMGDGRGGNAERFDVKGVGFGSVPIADPSLYPGIERCIAIFDAAVDRLANAVLETEDARLDALVPWAQMQVPLWTMAQRMVFHTGTHCGQLADLRRAMGMGSIFA